MEAEFRSIIRSRVKTAECFPEVSYLLSASYSGKHIQVLLTTATWRLCCYGTNRFLIIISFMIRKGFVIETSSKLAYREIPVFRAGLVLNVATAYTGLYSQPCSAMNQEIAYLKSKHRYLRNIRRFFPTASWIIPVTYSTRLQKQGHSIQQANIGVMSFGSGFKTHKRLPASECIGGLQQDNAGFPEQGNIIFWWKSHIMNKWAEQIGEKQWRRWNSFLMVPHFRAKCTHWFVCIGCLVFNL